MEGKDMKVRERGRGGGGEGKKIEVGNQRTFFK